MKIIATTETKTTGMRDVRQLLKSGATCDRLADYTFRSSEEVAFFLRGLDTDEVIATGLTQASLDKAYQQLCTVQNKLDALDSLSVTIAYEFRRDSSKLMPLLASVKQSLQTKRDKSLARMQKEARKQAPAVLSSAVTAAKELLVREIGKDYKSASDYVYVTAKNGELTFNHYLQFDQLLNKTQSYVYPQYYFVLSAVVNGEDVKLYANTLHKFRAPGAFTLGDQITADVSEVLNNLLAADEFSQQIAADQVVLDASAFRTPCESARAIDGQIVVGFRGTRDQCMAYTRSLHTELMTALDLRHHGLKYILTPKSKNLFHAQYVAVPHGGLSGITAKNQTGLTNDQIASVKHLLMKGF